VPVRLGGIVDAVLGLQTVSQAHSMKKRIAPDAVGTGYRLTHDASDFATLYGADGLPPASGATIAIVAVGNLYLTLNDLASFATMKGWPAVDAQVIQPAGPAEDYVDWEEWNMDSQASLGAAGGQVKQMLFYDVPEYSDAALEAAFNAAVSDNRAQTISVSIGECENLARPSGFEAAADLTFEIAIAQGQTFAFATGDVGSFQCDLEFNGSTYPAVSPWVMAIGGTTLITQDDLTSYVKENAWTCRNRDECFIDGGTGGGASKTERIPSWQKGLVGRKRLAVSRSIPDVAFDADPYTGLNLWDHGAIDGPIGGTSLATPIFAGLWTRIQSAHGNTLGFPAMSLYGLHDSDAGVFNDVLVGRNGGYVAQPGWDDVSGFGSFDAGRLSAFIDANLAAFSKP
jgi:pseudomonalisin/xanthomonalisin